MGECARGRGETQIDERKYYVIKQPLMERPCSQTVLMFFLSRMAMPPTAAAKYRSSTTCAKQAPKNQLASVVRRRWMCHTRTVLPAGGAAERQFFNVAVLSAC